MPFAPFPIAGVDEVGRGPLAGPVTAAAVILDPHRPVDGLLDSKALDAAERERLDRLVRRRALAFCIAEASVEEIDRLNILQASLLAMRRAIEGLSLPQDGHRGGSPRPTLVLVDGNCLPGSDLAEAAVVKGDARVAAISAASIIAKVARDRLMDELHAAFPAYGFDRHKGYPTAEHRAALLRHGPSVLHRTSFGPVREALAAQTAQPPAKALASAAGPAAARTPHP